MENVQLVFRVMTAAFALGVIWPVLDRRRAWSVYGSLGLAMLGCAITLGWAVSVFRQSVEQSKGVSLWSGNLLIAGQELLFPWEIRVDYLSAFFMVLIASFAMVVALYSFSALQTDHYRLYSHRIAAALNLFVWSTLLVVLVNDIFFLLAVLEVMTLSFGFLALYKHTLYLDQDSTDEVKGKDARQAGPVYMIISHAGTAFLFPALLLPAAAAGGFSFDALRGNADNLSPSVATLIFLLTFIGLGIRAGLTPAHFWVSLVHPASPTPTHALSLGISIKVGIYLMIRCFFQFLSPQPWWGYVVVVVAVATALINVRYAITSHDLKTALAYHSVENIGIITAAIGVALIFAPPGFGTTETIVFLYLAKFSPLAMLALAAGLYHLLNHAVFKGLLYLATGAIDALTGQVVEIEKLGGLIKIYPWTAAAFWVGSVAIAGFPPFNGFISEWLTLYSFLGGMAAFKFNESGWELAIIIFSFLGLVASFALTAFCFVKLAGLVLLGQPRLAEAERAGWRKTDAPWPMRIGMVGLSVLCLLLGVFPAAVLPWLLKVVGSVLGRPGVLAPIISLDQNQLLLPVIAKISQLAIYPVLLMVIFGVIGLIGGNVFSRKPRTLHPASPWHGGEAYHPQTTQYTGAALSSLIRGTVPLGHSLPEKDEAQDYLPARIDLSRSRDYPQVEVEFFRVGYNRIIVWCLEKSRQAGELIQNGDLRRYVFYIFLSNVVVLLLFLWLGGGDG